MKTCSKCKVERPVDDFYKRSDTGKVRSDCKVCFNAKAATRWKTNPDFRERGYKRSSKHQLMRKYGITPVQHTELLTKANGCCEICGTNQCPTGNMLAVDHCHSTGKVRGMLCQACNTALGQFKDDQDLLTKAINYLKESQ